MLSSLATTSSRGVLKSLCQSIPRGHLQREKSTSGFSTTSYCKTVKMKAQKDHPLWPIAVSMFKTNQFPIMPLESCHKRHQCFFKKKNVSPVKEKFTISPMFSSDRDLHYNVRDMSDVNRKPAKC